MTDNHSDTNKKTFVYRILLSLLFGIVVMIALWIGFESGVMYSNKNSDVWIGYDHLQDTEDSKINLILSYIKDNYVDSINVENLENDAIAAFLHQLDPHSDFIPPQDYSDIKEQMVGNFEGIGVEFNIIQDTVRVIQTIKNGPSEKAGLMAGDKIVSVNDTNFTGKNITTEMVFKKLRGKKGTKVKLGIKRPMFDKILYFNIERDAIPLYSVDVYYIINKDIGYIRIDRFAQNTVKEFETAMQQLLKQGMKKLILDLRDNPGGILDAAVEISDHFLPENTPIVYTEGRKYPRRTYKATSKGLFETQPLIVLINEGSASASEIIAGAIQDNDRGTIVGRRSFGKGLVQEELNLPDGSAVRLTVARYYTPTGRCIQKPYTPKDLNKYYLEEYERYLNGETIKLDSTKLDTTKKYITPKGKIVYGGGGIVPDIFIPVDTSIHTNKINKYLISGCLQQYALSIVDAQRKSLLQMYSDIKKFSQMYSIDDKMLQDMFYYCKNINDIPQLNNQEKLKFKTILKAHIARLLYGSSAYYPIINTTDNMIHKAIQVLEQQKDFNF